MKEVEGFIQFMCEQEGVPNGPYWRSQRIMHITGEVAKAADGCILEIGAGNGETTKGMLIHGRKVLVIDPFESGWNDMPESYGKPYPYDQFKKNVGDSPNLIVHKYSSQDKSCYDFIFQHAPISFAFIDGLQYKDAVLSDLRLVAAFNPAVICVDDVNRLSDISQVPLALDEFLPSSNYKLVKTDREIMEGYLVRKS